MQRKHLVHRLIRIERIQNQVCLSGINLASLVPKEAAALSVQRLLPPMKDHLIASESLFLI